MIRHLTECLLPRKCILCRSLLSKAETDLCTECRRDQPEYPYGRKKVPHITDLTAVWRYSGEVRSSLHRYKFRGARHYASAYGRLVAMRVLRDVEGVGICELTNADVVRHVMVQRNVKAYEQYEQSKNGGKKK